MIEVPQSDQDAATQRLLAPLAGTTQIGNLPDEAYDDFDPGFWETAKAAWHLESVGQSLADWGFSRLLEERALGWEDPGFSPHDYYADNQEALADVEPFVLNGYFDNTTNEFQFHERLGRLRKEAERRRIVAEGNGWGLALGLGATLFDISSLVPVVGRARTLNRGAAAVLLAGSTAGAVGATEAALHATQEHRTLEESILATGAGFLFGGGVGAFAGRSVQSPKLMDEISNEGTEASVSASGRLSEAEPTSVDEVADELRAGSVGAASAQDNIESAFGFGDGPLSKAGAVLEKTTPAGRALRWTSGVMKDYASKAMDIGGRRTNRDMLGLSTKNAERRAEGLFVEIERERSRHYDRAFRLNMELGGTKSRARYGLQEARQEIGNTVRYARGQELQSSSGGRLSANEFANVTHRVLTDTFSEEDMAELTGRWGDEGAEKIVTAAQEQAESLRQMMLRFEDYLVDSELLDPKKRMGIDYVLPQVWDGKAIAQNRSRFRAALIEMMSSEPADDFLKEFGLSADDWPRLGTDEVDYVVRADDGTESVKRLTPEEGEQLRNEVLEDWAGRVKDEQIDTLDKALGQAKADLQQARQLARDAFHEITKKTTLLRDTTIRAKKEALKASRERAEVRRAADEQMIEGARREKNSIELQLQREDGRDPVKAANLRGRITELDRRIRQAGERLQRRAAALDRAESALRAEETLRGTYASLLKQARAVRKEARKTRGKKTTEAKRLARRLDKALKSPDLVGRVDEMVELMAKGANVPGGLLDEMGTVSSRLRERRIRLDGDWRRTFEDMGVLRKDLYPLLDRTYRELSYRIGLKEAWGSDSAVDAIKAVRADYTVKAETARAAGDDAAADKLLEEMEAAALELQNIRDRGLGLLDVPDSPDSWLTYIGQQARKFNFVRVGVGFGVSSLTDLSNVLMVQSGALTNGRAFKRMQSLIKDMDQSELARIVYALEQTLRHSRAGQVADIDDSLKGSGLGLYGSRKERVTGAVSRGLDAMAEGATALSGLRAWNHRLKLMVMVEAQTKLSEFVDDYATLNQKMGELAERRKAEGYALTKDDKALLREVSGWANLGIGSEEAALISKMKARFGESVLDDVGGVREMHIDRWLAEGGAEGADAYHAVTGALMTAANRAIPTPGIGDTPFFMSTQSGKLLMQFQSYGFLSINKWMAPGRERVVHLADAEALMSFMSAAVLGAAVVYGKDLMAYGEIRERTPQQLGYDIIDRAGFLAFTSPYLSAGMKTIGLDGSTRFRGVNTVGQLLGPTFGAARDTTDLFHNSAKAMFGGITESGEPVDRAEVAERAYQKAKRLAPYSTLWRLADVINGGVESN